MQHTSVADFDYFGQKSHVFLIANSVWATTSRDGINTDNPTCIYAGSFLELAWAKTFIRPRLPFSCLYFRDPDALAYGWKLT